MISYEIDAVNQYYRRIGLTTKSSDNYSAIAPDNHVSTMLKLRFQKDNIEIFKRLECTDTLGI